MPAVMAVIIGHVEALGGAEDAGHMTIRPLWTSALEQHAWAERLCGGALLTVRMVLANIQYLISQYLESRAGADKAGTCDALSLGNVP